MAIERDLRDRSEFEPKHGLPPPLPLAELASEAHWLTTTMPLLATTAFIGPDQREKDRTRERRLDFGSGKVQQP